MSHETGRALISVSNKQGLDKFKTLKNLGWQIISTGGTARTLREHDIACTDVTEVTGMPADFLGGRIKTLDAKIAAGILAEFPNEDHMKQLADVSARPIDMVVINFYDFAGNPGREQIDIGGPTMIRAAVKNLPDVLPLIDPDDYEWVINRLAHGTGFMPRERMKLAVKVMRATSDFDSKVADWLEQRV